MRQHVQRAPSLREGARAGAGPGVVSRDGPNGAAERLQLSHVGLVFQPAGRRKSAYHAVEDVSFSVEQNEFICVVGPSGCGKSSILLAVAGLVPVSSGDITVDGAIVDGPADDRAVVFQSASLFPWRTALANVSYGLEMGGIAKREARKRATAMMHLVGLEGFESRYPHELSGGMQQRVNLARALAANPRLLLMDEPFAALDAQTRELMQGELLRVWEQMRKSVLFITHQIDEAIFLGDRVVVLTRGPRTTVQETVTVPFSRPRVDSLKRSPEFMHIVDHIWSLIRNG